MELYVFAGPNGSGKSTFIASFLKKNEEKNLPYICPDGFFSYLYPNIKPSSPDYAEKYINSMKLAENLRVDFIKNKISFSFETVLSREEKIDFIKFAKSNGFRVLSFFITTENPEINLRRVADRVKSGGHDVPPEKIASRYYRSMGLIKPLIELSDELSVYDNSGARFVLAYQQDLRRCYVNPSFEDKPWMKEYVLPHVIAIARIL